MKVYLTWYELDEMLQLVMGHEPYSKGWPGRVTKSSTTGDVYLAKTKDDKPVYVRNKELQRASPVFLETGRTIARGDPLSKDQERNVVEWGLYHMYGDSPPADVSSDVTFNIDRL